MSNHKIQKGALVKLEHQGAAKKILTFQFNPESLSRILTVSEDSGKIHEAIRFGLVFNASEGLEAEDEAIVEQGVYPQLAALEVLLENQYEQNSGWIDIFFGRLFGSLDKGLVTLVWGQRVIPVRLLRVNIKEQVLNSQLKPIHAVVDIKLRILTKPDLSGHAAGLQALNAYRQQRNAIAETLGFD